MNDFDLRKYLAEGILLKEAKDNPKAIILAGGAGVGKSYIIKNLLGDLDEEAEVFFPKGSPLKFKYLNVDNFVEKKGLSLGAAQGEFRGEFQDVQNKRENIQKFKDIDWSSVAFLSTNSAYNIRSSQIIEQFT